MNLFQAIAIQALINAKRGLFNTPPELRELVKQLKSEGVLAERHIVTGWTKGGIGSASMPITDPQLVWACNYTDCYYENGYPAKS